MSAGRRARRRRGRLPGLRCLDAGGRARWRAPGYLVPANTEVALLRRVPAARPAARARRGLQHQRARDRDPAAARRVRRARGGGRPAACDDLLTVPGARPRARPPRRSTRSRARCWTPDESPSPRVDPSRPRSRPTELGLGVGLGLGGSRPPSRMAPVTSTGAARSICHGRAPYAASCAAHGVEQLARLAGRGRRPQGAAQVVGGEQVLDRQVVLLGERGHRRAGQR